MSGVEQAPTRAALLALKEERTVVGEAYEFLDEKRLLLAAELLKQLEVYERLLAEFDTLSGDARQSLIAAIERHGLQGLDAYPAEISEQFQLDTDYRNFLGVTLVETAANVSGTDPKHQAPACNPSFEAKTCRQVFREMLLQSAVLAGISGNLHRLLSEYRLTERRAKALENVILPEIEQTLDEMTTHLEELELEDAIRVRYQQR